MKSPCLLVALAVASYTTSHCLCAIADNGPTLPPIPDLQNLAKAISFFSMDLHTVLRETRDSFFFSPVSIHLALSMAIVGAKGATSKELKITLEVSKIRNLNEQYKGWLAWAPDNCNLGKDCEIQLNKTYLINPDISVDEKFTSAINWIYTPSAVDLETKTGWTFITFLPSNTKREHAGETPFSAMIVNVVHLRLRWRQKFIYNAGNYMDFTTSTYKNIKTTSMRARGKFGYSLSQELNGHVLKIPFENDRFSFYVVLPTTAEGLDKLEDQLARRSVHLDEVFDSVQVRDVLVELPTFRVVEVIDLDALLQKLGINAAFSQAADFTNVTPLPCKFGQARHIALIALDLTHVTIGSDRFLYLHEEGATAPPSSKTTVSTRPKTTLSKKDEDDDGKDDEEDDQDEDNRIYGRSARVAGGEVKALVAVKASHPFLFFVRDELFGVLIIQGRMLEPVTKP